jgi:prefoldin subunit 5
MDGFWKWLNANPTVTLAIIGVLGAIAYWIRSKATVQAVQEAGDKTVAAVASSNYAADQRAKTTASVLVKSGEATAANVAEVRESLQEHKDNATAILESHSETLAEIKKDVNSNTQALLDRIASLEGQVATLTTDKATLAADAKKQ